MPSRSSRSLLMLIAAGLLWGTGGVTGRALADSTHLAAPAIAAYRLGLGGAVLVAMQLLRRASLPRSRAAWSRILTVAVLAAVFQCSYFTAVAICQVSTATLITIGSAPIFVLAADAIRDRKRPTLRIARPALIGIAGLTALIGVPAAGTSLVADVTGAGLALLSGASFASLTLLGRRALPPGLDEQTVIGFGFAIGGLGLAAICAPFLSFSFAVTPQNVALLLLLATAPTAIAYTLFFIGLRQATAATAAVLALLEPLTGTVLAIMLFGDRLSFVGILGGATLLAAVVDTVRSHDAAADQNSAPSVHPR